MAALGGSRHALINLSTQIDIPPIIKKSGADQKDLPGRFGSGK